MHIRCDIKFFREIWGFVGAEDTQKSSGLVRANDSYGRLLP